MGPEDWQRLAGLATDASGGAYSLAARAILDLHDQVDALQQELADIEDREDFNVRLEALKAGRALVLDLTAEKNERNYPRYFISAPDRLGQELRIARYLLGEKE